MALRCLNDVSVFGQHHFDFGFLGLVVVAVNLALDAGHALCASRGLKFTGLRGTGHLLGILRRERHQRFCHGAYLHDLPAFLCPRHHVLNIPSLTRK